MGVVVTGDDKGRKARAFGVLRCNSIHACAVCSRAIRARRMAELTKVLRGGLELHKALVWRMLSLTVRHDAGMSLEQTRKGLMRAWRRTRQNGSVQRIFRRLVRGSVRSIEVTFGENGWHPHLHVGVLTAAWSATEEATLLRVWQDACEIELGKRGRPDDAHAIVWSARKLARGDGGATLERYLTDIGLEFSTVSTKTTRRTSSRTPWQILDSASEGNTRDVARWREYEWAMKGARCIELDARAKAFAKDAPIPMTRGETGPCDELSFESAEVVGATTVRVELHPEMLAIVRRYERVDRRATLLWLEAAAAPGPLTVAGVTERIDACLRWMVEKTRGRDPGILAA